jgi:signal transduction histidine kinase
MALRANPHLLAQALANLLDNGVKFTRRGAACASTSAAARAVR